MARLRLNPRRAKIHRSYSVAEAARLFAVSRATVRAWAKAGLATVRISGAILIYGEDLQDFLTERQAAQRTKCSPGTFYCLGCRAARCPRPGSVVLGQTGGRVGNLRAPCPRCGSVMNRRVALSKIADAGFDASLIRAGERHWADSPHPSLKLHSQGIEEA